MLVSNVSFNQVDFDKRTLDAFIDQIYENQKASLSVTINQGGQTIYGYARAIREIKDEAITEGDATSIFRIGSITKTFTATLIMKAIEEGKLQLDDPLSKYYPDIKNAEKITIEHMLRHRSGIYNFTDNGIYTAMLSTATESSKVKELITTLTSDFEPDSTFSYSNTGYILLGYILEDLYGKKYQDLVKEKIATPFDLKSYGFMKQVDPEDNVVYSAMYDGNKWSVIDYFTNPLIVDAAGAITMNGSDLASFWHHLFNGDIISDASLDQMKELEEGYGFGLYQMPFGIRKVYAHNGGVDGYHSNASYWDKEDMSIVVLVNGLNMEYNDIMIGVLSIVSKVPYTFPMWTSKEVERGILESYEGIYATDSFPLDITISVKVGKLFAQATGQGAFPLVAQSDTEFKFDGAGITITFDKPDGFHFNQNGYEVDFVRE